MAIILRDDTSNNTGKGSELTYLEMDTNLESFYYSSSLDGTDLTLHTTGSASHTIDLSGLAGAGAQGTIGSQGTVGTGTQGTQGTVGTGTQGTQGTVGTGTQGTQGTIGSQGISGVGGVDITPLSSATGSYLFSGSFDGTDTITLYSEDTNYSLDLSALAGGSTDITPLNSATGSYLFSGSFDGTDTITLYSEDTNYSLDLSALAGGSTDITELNNFTGSAQISLTALNAATGSYVYSGSYNSAASAITLYSANQNYTLDLSGLAGGGGGSPVTASDEGSDLTNSMSKIDFVGNAVTATNVGSVVTVAVNTGSASDTNIANTDLSVTANRILDLAGNSLIISASNNRDSFTIDSRADLDVNITNLTDATKPYAISYDPTTGKLGYMPTGSIVSGGGATSPGGSDTYVQFNDGGSFGGDSGLVYNKTTNRLTITATGSATRTAPNLLLNSEIGNVVTDEVFGVIAANNTTDTYSPANFPASIQFAADTNFGPGNYDTRVGIFVNSNATELEAIRLKSSGQNQLPQYGSGNFTGTPAKTLAVDSSGNVIETAVLDTGSLENPSIGRDTTNSVTNVVFDVSIATADANWTLEAVTVGGTPSGAGKARISNSSPASATQFSVWKTANSSVDMSSPLEQLAPGSIITLTAVGANTATGTYRVTAKSLSTNAVTYTISYIEGAAYTYAIGATFTIDTVEGVFEYDLAPGYNYLNIRNNGSSSDRLRLRYEAATGEYPDGGGYIPVQILCHGSGQGYSLDYIADNKTYSWSLTGTTGTWSSTNPVIGFITNDFKPGDRFISSFLVWGEGNNEGIVPQNWTVYQSDTALEPSDRTVPTQYYQNTFNSSERITTTTVPNLYELNGGTINIDPQGGTSDALIIGLGGLLTDYSTAVNNVNGANLVQLNIVTPTAKNGWSIYWLGYRSSTNERYRVVNTSINGGTGTNSPVKLDWSGRAEISVDFSESKIFVWSSNWEN